MCLPELKDLEEDTVEMREEVMRMMAIPMVAKKPHVVLIAGCIASGPPPFHIQTHKHTSER